MAKTDADTNAVLALFESLGISPEAVAKAIGTVQVSTREARPIEVTVLEGDAKKYGDVQISKLSSTGRVIKGLAFSKADAQVVVNELTAALELLS